MGKGPFSITVSAQALDKSQPSRNALNNCTHTISVGVANMNAYKKKLSKGKKSLGK